MKYIIKKILTLIMTLFLVSVAAFLAFQIIPGDVVTSILGTEATPEREEQLREELGLNKPPVVRYFHAKRRTPCISTHSNIPPKM